jgi:MFS family permease
MTDRGEHRVRPAARRTSLSPTRERLLLAAVVSGLLLAMLDQTIVGTALPAIVRDLDGSSLYLWVVTAYLVPATVSLPVYARLSDRHGRRVLLLAAWHCSCSDRRRRPARKTWRS